MKEREVGLTPAEIIEIRKTKVKTYEEEISSKMKKCQETSNLRLEKKEAKRMDQNNTL